MAQGDITIYNAFKEDLMLGVHNLAEASHSVIVTLHTGYTPDIDTHQVWADTGVSSTEYGTAAGYTAGGMTLANQTVTQDNTNDRALFDADNPTWTTLGPLTPATPGHSLIWNTTPTSPADPLMAYLEIGVTATNGGDYTLAWSAAPSAIISLT
jgi:hypothetical protein